MMLLSLFSRHEILLTPGDAAGFLVLILVLILTAARLILKP